MKIDEIIRAALEELANATVCHPTWPTDPQHAMVILQEEVGELARAVNMVADGTGPIGAVRTEAIQVAAMAFRFAASLAEYSYLPAVQHVQAGWRVEAGHILTGGPQ